MPAWRAPLWVTQLAEELADLAAMTVLSGDPAHVQTISIKLRAAAEAHHYDRWMLTQQVASEWHRLGIVTIPGNLPLERVR